MIFGKCRNDNSVKTLIQQLIAQEKKDMAALDDAIAKIQTDVTTLTTAVQTAVTNLGNLASQIAALQQQLAGAGVSQAQLDALAAISTGIESETSALNAAAPASPTP